MFMVNKVEYINVFSITCLTRSRLVYSVEQYSDGVKYADLCFNATLVQATRINKEVSQYCQ